MKFLKMLFNPPFYKVECSPLTGRYVLFKRLYHGYCPISYHSTLEEAKKAIEIDENNPVYQK